MKPNLTDHPCIHCGAKPSRDWSDIVEGAIICDSCPVIKSTPDPLWDFPVLIAETQIEPDIWVRTCAFERMTKYGYCWHTFAVDGKTSQMKEVRVYKTRAEAEAQHQECVNFVIVRRSEMKRAHGS